MLSVDASLIAVFVIVWILLALLTKIFFNPLRKIMEGRKSGIKNDQDASQKAVEDYGNTLKEIEEGIRSTRMAANETRDAFTREALEEKERILAEISRECRDQVDQARRELEQQIEDLKKDLKKDSGVLAEQIAKRMMD